MENCFRPAELQKFIAEETEVDLAEKIENHLKTCERCLQRLNGIQDSNSRKYESFRKLHLEGDRDELPELPKPLLKALLEIGKSPLKAD